MKQEGGGKALLFEQPVLMNGQRSAFPVGINLFGSMRRMSMSLGVESLDDVGVRIDEMLAMKVPEGIIAKLALPPRLLEMGKFPPRTKKGAAASQEIVWRDAEVDLDKLPLMKCWPEDGGAYITFPMVITRDRSAAFRTSGCTASCRTESRRSRCTGSATRSARRTGARWPSVAKDAGVHRARRRSAVDVLGERTAPPTVDEFLFADSCDARLSRSPRP